MSIEGRIAIDVNFTDTSTAGGASSVKKISLVDTTAYTSGKVAVVTGTAGTAGVNIDVLSPGYIGANGVAVTLTPSRCAFVVTRESDVATDGDQAASFFSPANVITLFHVGDNASTLNCVPTGGTAIYTAVFYGS